MENIFRFPFSTFYLAPLNHSQNSVTTSVVSRTTRKEWEEATQVAMEERIILEVIHLLALRNINKLLTTASFSILQGVRTYFLARTHPEDVAFFC